MNLEGNITSSNSSSFILEQDNQKISFVLMCILYTFGLFTVILNMPSIVIVLGTFCRKATVKDIHILSLSITDAILGFSWLLMTATLFGKKMSFANCVVRCYFLGTSFFASLMQVFGIGFERVLVICGNCTAIKYRRNEVAIGIVMLSWGLSVLVISLMSLFTVYPYQESQVCSVDHIFAEKQKRKQPFLTFGLVSGLIQFAIIINMTTLFGFLVHHHKKLDRENVRPIQRSDIRLCATICIIAVLFFGANSPITLVYLIDGFDDRITSSKVLRNAAFLFAGINSAINPFVYIFRTKDFRQLFLKSACHIGYCKRAPTPEPHANSRITDS